MKASKRKSPLMAIICVKRLIVKKLFRNLTGAQAFLIVAVGLAPAQALAYLDPGTGSMILQGIIAAVAIAGFTLKNYWYRILGYFGKNSPDKKPLDADEQTQRHDNQAP